MIGAKPTGKAPLHVSMDIGIAALRKVQSVLPKLLAIN